MLHFKGYNVIFMFIAILIIFEMIKSHLLVLSSALFLLFYACINETSIF